MENEKTESGKESTGACLPTMTDYVLDLKERWKLKEDNPTPDFTVSDRESEFLAMARHDIKKAVEIIESAQQLCEIYYNIARDAIGEGPLVEKRDRIIDDVNKEE